MITRTKFHCSSVRKYESTIWEKDGSLHQGFVYGYEFNAVTGNSEENKQFYASTPGGSLTLSSVREDLFTPGENYYLDFTAVTVKIAEA